MTDKSIPLYSLLNQCECFLFSRKGAGMKLFEAVKEAVTARSALQNIMESKLDETEWLSARSIRTRIQA